MSKREDYEARTEALLLPIMEEMNFELVDVEYVKEAGNWYLRGYIDKPGGIAVDDCEAVSRRFSDILDEKDYIEDSYIFEVSSPGLDRVLKRDHEYVKYKGRIVDVKLFKAVDGVKEFQGTLQGLDENDNVTIITEDNRTLAFNRKDIATTRLAVIL